jgi:hypothetical protein
LLPESLVLLLFATGVNDTGGNDTGVAHWAENIFEKIRNGTNSMLRGMNKPEVENLVALSL